MADTLQCSQTKKEIDATLSIESVIAELPDLDDDVIEHEEDSYLFDDMQYEEDHIELLDEHDLLIDKEDDH